MARKTKDPFKMDGVGGRRFPSLKSMLNISMNEPRLGLTQGGSSRKDSGARVAARRGQRRATRG